METRGPEPATTIATTWLDPRQLVPCDPPTDIPKLLRLIAVFQARRGAETVPPILTMPLLANESRLLVLDGNHRAAAALAARRRLRGKVCRSSEDLEAVGQGTPAQEARRLGFAGCMESFLKIAIGRQWIPGGFTRYLERAGLGVNRELDRKPG